jgi:hypothetical protein
VDQQRAGLVDVDSSRPGHDAARPCAVRGMVG